MDRKITLSVEQMKHLQELGLDVSDASMWTIDIEGSDFERPRSVLNGEHFHDKYFSWLYTLPDLLDKLENKSTLPSLIKTHNGEEDCYFYAVSYCSSDEFLNSHDLWDKNPLNAVYKRLCLQLGSNGE